MKQINNLDTRYFIQRLVDVNLSSSIFFAAINGFIFYFAVNAYKDNLIIPMLFLLLIQRFIYIGFVINVGSLYNKDIKSYRSFKQFNLSWIESVYREKAVFINVMILIAIHLLCLLILSLMKPLYLIVGLILYPIFTGSYIDIIYNKNDIVSAIRNQIYKFDNNTRLYELFYKRIIFILIFFTIFFISINKIEFIRFSLYYGLFNLFGNLMFMFLFIEDIIYFLSIPAFVNSKEMI